MKNNSAKNSTTKTHTSNAMHADCRLLEVVGDTLVSQDFMLMLIAEAKGKISLFRNVTSIPELLGEDFYASLTNEERAIVGDCLVKLIETQRIALHPDSMVN